MTLASTQKKYLRGLCHELDPVVTVGGKGLTDAVCAELEQALTHHELIKVKLRGQREQRDDWIEMIRQRTGASVVQKIGQVACFYRRNPDKPGIAIPE